MARSEEELALLKQFFGEEYEKLAAIERQREMLKAEPRGEGPHLRPSDQFIDDNLGPPKSHVEICDIATAKAEAKLNAHYAEQERQQEVKASWERHNKAIEARKAELSAPEQGDDQTAEKTPDRSQDHNGPKDEKSEDRSDDRDDTRPKIYRDGGPDYEAAMERFRARENAPQDGFLEEEKGKARDAARDAFGQTRPDQIPPDQGRDDPDQDRER